MWGAANHEGEQGVNLGRNAGAVVRHRPPRPGAHAQPVLLVVAADDPHGRARDQGGEGDQYIAGGSEAVSRATGRDVPFHPQLDGSPESKYDVYIPMGMTAENVAERCHVSRSSRTRGRSSRRPRGRRPGEPATSTGDRPGHLPDGTVVTKDDGPRPGTTMEKLASLKPVFKEDGTVTAGNACPLNDGAAATLVMSDEKARSLGLQPKARIVASSVAAIRPEIMGLGPIPAIKAVLKQAGMTMDDIDIVEINEAFAAQIVPCKEELGIDDDKLNPFGGAIALGHPFGMTGARIMTTLLNDLETLDKTYGIESMCVAGGMGMAMIVERLN
jgi:acetyl-CoA C-acetyltransferase